MFRVGRNGQGNGHQSAAAFGVADLEGVGMLAVMNRPELFAA